MLEPYALGELLQYFAWDSLSGLGLLEARSYFAGRIGERVFDEKVTLADDALDPRGLPKAFDFEGEPKQRVTLVEEGIARGVVWDRRTAKRAGGDVRGTGHAPPVGLEAYGPQATALSLAGGDAELARRARRCGRRRHLHHATPLSRHRQSARGRDHRA